ncbi:hypothetical protein Q765_04045 [Flavobacterium rivuli WB 3.3-2 = DSM 21788]|uniref:Ig-like domain-containing protein n=1 Tax=Flavobacterium rivuli WB 3.3-2 = DSM 21788 TaxID=1121895 RepID=A0A0A2M6F0_9FLAO|nr:T9SS type A sorting domain-containing protein [Flavobacterium rivuli]KGO88217.1 hypothetical protein Q765_04045 [Flavobacterium rivuli WB 3.3-2 = DSM 21788]
MKNLTNKLSLNSLPLLLLVCLFGFQAANAQTCTPQGNQTAYGDGQWKGYLYNNVTTFPPTAAAFAPANYRGYVTRSANFNQDIGEGALPAESTLCTGTYDANFIMRYKMQVTVAPGYYTFNVGGDDGYRLSFDEGQTFPENVSDWSDHGYHYETATYYLSGTVKLILEYYEHNGSSRVSFDFAPASCTSSAPTTITGNGTSSCATGTTLTATGGTAGVNCTYQWGIGSVIGQNIIPNQTGVSISVHPSSTKTYWVRRVSAAPCSTTTDGVTRTVTVANPAPGNPAVYGDGVWNVYSYIGNSLDLNPTIVDYSGYYTDATLGYDSQAKWNKAGAPSSAAGYQGCSLPVDQFTFIAKRKGFTCGSYTVKMENWDDDSRLYINGTQVWNFNGYSGGQPIQNIGTYSLDANSTIELRTGENGGDANAKLTIVQINTPVAPTSITGVSTICKNTSITLTATGASPAAGGVYQWGTGTVVGENILAETTTNTFTTVIPATTTYWVRIKNTEGCYTAGVTKAITVPAPLVYNNGAWNGTPTIETAVEIQSDLTMSQNIEVCSCQVKANATLTVATGKTLTVKNKLTVDANGKLIVENNGALLQIAQVPAEGNITLHKTGNPLYRLDYTMWSAPVTGQNLAAFSPQTISTRFYKYGYAITNTTTNTGGEYYNLIDPATNNFMPAQSYLIRMPDQDNTTGYNAGRATLSFDGIFTGVPNNGNYTTPASVQGNRYTAVGNPYPSPISVKEFFNQNAGVLDANSAIYLWRKKNDYRQSSYATITLAAYTKNSATGGGAEQGVYFGRDNNTWLLSQGQGFIVRTATNATNTNITFTNSMRKAAPASGSQSFFRTGEDTASRLWLNITDGQDGFSQAAVAYMEEGTLGLDYGYDGKMLSDSSDISIYSIAEESKLTIQARPLFTAGDVVPMGYKAGAAGEFTIALDHTEGVFAEGQDIFLKDNVLGTTTNVTNQGYTFTTEAGTFDDRFEVVYATEALGTNNPQITANSVIVYKEGSSININTGTAQMTDVAVYDIQGRRLYAKSGINATTAVVSGLQVQTEVLIIEINTVKGKVSKKIVF